MQPQSRFFHFALGLVALHLGLGPRSQAQDGTLDFGFDPGSGVQYVPVIRSLAVQPDGRFFIFGDFDSLNATPYPSIARFVSDDSLDTTFKPPTTGIPRFEGQIRAAALLPDGRLLIGGNLAIYGSTYSDYRSSLCRVNADGSLDTAFKNTFSSGVVNAIGLQSDGKILVGGQFLALQGTTEVVSVVRLYANGARDNSYPVSIAANARIHFIQVLTNDTPNTNSVRIGGVLPEVNGSRTNYLLSIKVDGTVESAYGGPGAVNGAVVSKASQADGKFLLAGFFTQANGVPWNHVVRLNSDNTPDPTFNIGSGADAEVMAVVVQSDGKIVLAGGFTSFNGTPCGGVVRLNSDGSIDSAFKAGSGAIDRIYQMQSRPNGDLILMGAFSAFNGTPRAGIARLSNDGSLLASFASLTPLSLVKCGVYATTLQPDGKILIGGNFNAVRGRNLPGVARLNSDGTLDAAFHPGMGVDGLVQNIAVDSDGKILVAGTFTGVQGAIRTSLARLQPDGSLDLSFAPTLLRLDGTAGSLSRVVLSPNRQILVGGHFRSLNGVSRNYLARLNNDGSLDSSFDTQILIQGHDWFYPSKLLIGQNPTVEAVAPQPDGKILAGGYVTWDGLSQGYLMRLNTNGQMDTNFVPTSLPATNYVATNVIVTTGTVRDVTVLGNGKILACGNFSEIRMQVFDRPRRVGIARFEANGQLDPGFTTGMGANAEVRALAVQSDDKILIGGAFQRYNIPDLSIPNNRIRVARLNADGSLDETFQPGTGANDTVNTVLWLPTGRALIGGAFTNYNGTIRRGLARVIAQSVFSADNVPPTVSLIAIGLNSETKFTAPATIVLGADAKDPDGTIARVEFYSGTTKLGQATVAPFSFGWINVPAGTHSLTAKAIDNQGATTTSTEVKVTVNATTPVPPPAPADTSLVVNGDFASGGSGWKLTRAPSGSVLDYPPGPPSCVAFGANQGLDDTISQTLSTVPGTAYTISFRLSVGTVHIGGNDNGNDFSVAFGGKTLFSATNLVAQDFTTYVFTAVAQTASTDLVFAGRNGPNSTKLTDVVVQMSNLVINGDFASGGSGWKLTRASSGSVVDYLAGPPSCVSFGANQGLDDTISQTLSTVPGTTYTISFRLSVGTVHVGGNDNGNDFSAVFGGKTLFSATNIAAQDFTTYVFTAVAQAASTDIVFAGRNGPNSTKLTGVVVQQSTTGAPTLTNTFPAWVTAHQLPAGADGLADSPSGDGVPNLLKFAMGLDPKVASRGGVVTPVIISRAGLKYVGLAFQHAKNATGIQLVLETSIDLVTWREVVAALEKVADLDATLESVRLVENAALDTQSARFYRLKVSLTDTNAVGDTVRIVVSPSAVTLTPGAPQTFVATVTGTQNLGVAWSVKEGAIGGSIDAQGGYTAPDEAGLFTVAATSIADPSKTATAQVFITDAPVTSDYYPQPVVSGATTAESKSFTTTSGQPASLNLSDGTRVDVPALSAPVTVTLARANNALDLGGSLQQASGSMRVITYSGNINFQELVPVVTFPAKEAGSLKAVNIARIGDLNLAGAQLKDRIVFLPVERDVSGNLSTRDVFLRISSLSTPPVTLASVQATPQTAVTVKYTVSTYQGNLNMIRAPQLVRMIPDKTAALTQRAPLSLLSKQRQEEILRKPIRNVVLLVHGHNEAEGIGYSRPDVKYPWWFAYKQDVWSSLYQQFQALYPEYMDCTAFYEYIYPTFRPIFAGTSSLGNDLAQLVAKDPQIKALKQKYNLFLVAHSMGGLVARAGLNQMDRSITDNLEKLITWGSPHHGSPAVTLRYLLTSGYNLDLPGMCGLLPSLEMLNEHEFYRNGVQSLAMDTPGERELRWDNYKPLNLEGAGWRRNIYQIADDARYDLAQNPDLYNNNLRTFNIEDKFILTDKYAAFYGITSETAKLDWSCLGLREFKKAAPIAQGNALTKWIYNNPGVLAGYPNNPPLKDGDGAVPVDSAAGLGIISMVNAAFAGDVDHEQFYERDGAGIAYRTFATLKVKDATDKKCDCPTLTVTRIETTLPTSKVTGKLIWPGDAQPGQRVLRFAVALGQGSSRVLTPAQSFTIQDDGNFIAIFDAAVLNPDTPGQTVDLLAQMKDGSELSAPTAQSGPISITPDPKFSGTYNGSGTGPHFSGRQGLIIFTANVTVSGTMSPEVDWSIEVLSSDRPTGNPSFVEGFLVMSGMGSNVILYDPPIYDGKSLNVVIRLHAFLRDNRKIEAHYDIAIKYPDWNSRPPDWFSPPP